jgi:hypothetical protein
MQEQPSRHMRTMSLSTARPGSQILVAAFIAIGAFSLGAYSSGLLDGTRSMLLSLTTISVISGFAALSRMSQSRRVAPVQHMEREHRDAARSR